MLPLFHRPTSTHLHTRTHAHPHARTHARTPARKRVCPPPKHTADPTETANLAAERPDIVAALRVVLQGYIGSAVTPLNLTPAERTPDPAAKAAAKKAGCWVPWQ